MITFTHRILSFATQIYDVFRKPLSWLPFYRTTMVLIIAFSVFSCKGHLKNEVEYHDIIIEWSGEIDKPIYKIIICTDCSFYQSVELCKLEVSDKIMKKIGETGFKNYRLTIDEQNREEGKIGRAHV